MTSRPWTRWWTTSLGQRRFDSFVMGIFGGLALLLAGVGIYGVLSSTVQQRTPEIGVRMALGAQRGDVLRMVMGYGLKLALAGMALGLVAGLHPDAPAGQPALRRQSHQSSYLPCGLRGIDAGRRRSRVTCRRATAVKVDPVRALRAE